MFKDIVLMILGVVVGALCLDLVNKVEISYNNSEVLKVVCKKGFTFEQVVPESEVYIKTNNECINETIKGSHNEQSNNKPKSN